MPFAFPDYDCLSSACLPAHPCLLMGLSLAAQSFHQYSGTSTVCSLMVTNAQHLTSWCVLVCLLSLSMLFAACPALCPKLSYHQVTHRCYWCLLPSNAGVIGVQEAGMFLRMASGLGYCQVGDYVASLFFLFRRRGHRYALAPAAQLHITIWA